MTPCVGAGAANAVVQTICGVRRDGVAMKQEREPEFADAFYRSRTWRRCRARYLQHVGGLCERCLQRGLTVPAEQVHHKIRLTPENLNDPAISLNWDNLEALCMTCHQAEHKQKRWMCDANGRVVVL